MWSWVHFCRRNWQTVYFSQCFTFSLRHSGAWENLQKEPPHDKPNKMVCAPSEASYQPGHPPSLIRVFAVRMKKIWVLSYSLSAQRRHWSDWADAQADLSLRGAQLFCWFFHKAARITCAQQWLRSTCAPIQSDQSLRCPHEDGVFGSLATHRVPSEDWSDCADWAGSLLGTCHFADFVDLRLTILFWMLNVHPVGTIIWAPSSENVSSKVCDRVTFKPACSATETS